MNEDGKHAVLFSIEKSEQARNERLRRLGINQHENFTTAITRAMVGLLDRIEALEAKAQ